VVKPTQPHFTMDLATFSVGPNHLSRGQCYLYWSI